MFTTPILLWGLFFVLIPVVIHLINLLRHRPVEWGAMEFLLTAYKKHRTRVRMKEMLLLLMRMVLIALVVLMLAGPVIRQVLPGGAKTHHIVVLDDSFSMSDRVGEGSVFENAKNAVQKLIDELARQGAAHNLTLIRTSQSKNGVGKTTKNETEIGTLNGTRHADVHEQRVGRNFRDIFSVEALETSHLAGGMEDALNYATELAPDAEGGNRILYIVSDFRARDWKENPAHTAQLSALVRDGFRVRLVDCAPVEHPNLAVSALKPTEGIQAAGVPILMAVKVTNFGISSAQNVVLHPELVGLEAGSIQTLPTVTIPEIPAGETVSASFSVTCPIAGNFAVRVSLPPDSISDDNQVLAALTIPDFESVLIIDDSLDGSVSRFLRTALAPGDRVQTGVVPRVEKARFLSTNDLSTFKSIYLLDTATLEPQAVTAIEEFLKKGGGVCIFTGPHTDPLMAQKWFREGMGFFPAMLDQTEELPPYYASPDIRVAPHPIFRVFSGESASLFNTIHVERYYTLDDASLENVIPLQDETALSQAERQKKRENEPNTEEKTEAKASENEDVHVIAALRNNAPLVLEKRFGRGKVVLFLTSADRKWTDWPVGNPARPNPYAQGSYVVMILQLQAYLAQKTMDFWTVGDTLQTVFPAERYEGISTFLKPDGTIWERVQAVARTDGAWEAVSSATLEPGIFCVELKENSGMTEKRNFAVNSDFHEGNVQKITREELVQGMGKIPFDWVEADDFRFAESDTAKSILSDWILAFILVWIALEMLLAASASYHLGGVTKPMKKGGEK